MGRNLVATSLIFDNVTIAASGASTSATVDIQASNAMALHINAMSGTSPDVTFTYALSTNETANFTTPASPVTIGASIAAVDVLDFAPEAAKYIRITATNNNGVNAVTFTGVLAVQEG